MSSSPSINPLLYFIYTVLCSDSNIHLDVSAGDLMFCRSTIDFNVTPLQFIVWVVQSDRIWGRIICNFIIQFSFIADQPSVHPGHHDSIVCTRGQFTSHRNTAEIQSSSCLFTVYIQSYTMSIFSWRLYRCRFFTILTLYYASYRGEEASPMKLQSRENWS